jgi:sporulation protein YlmC with PRC-barrel domain
MKYQTVTIAVLTLLIGACAPDSPDDERTSRQADRDTQADIGQMASEDTQPQRNPSRYGESGADSSMPPMSDSMSAMTQEDLIGKEVVDSNGEVLGNTQRVVQDRKSKQTMAVIAVQDPAGKESKEVVVPLHELRQEGSAGKLSLRMSKEQLASQPDAGDSDYVELDQTTNMESEPSPDSDDV